MSSDIISNLTSGAIYDNTMDFWNSITAPPLLSLITPYDVSLIDDISRDPKLKTNLDKKYEYYNQILVPRGFTRLTQGTNRVVYRHREDESFVIKLATSQAGLQDSPAEFKNQQIWLPDVAKCFEVSPSGTIGLFERVTPIRSKEQLISIIDEVYLFYYKLFRKRGGYVMADIGIEFYKNLGIRDNFGIVLLDYPLMYKIDKRKLFCDRVDRFGHVCGGQIDYDDGFNFLKCTRCGKQYLMKKLAIDSGTIEEYVTNFVKRKEVSDMKVLIKRGDEIIAESNDAVVNSNFINPAVSMRQQQVTPMVRNNTGRLNVQVIMGDEPIGETTPVEVQEVKQESARPITVNVTNYDNEPEVKEEPKVEEETVMEEVVVEEQVEEEPSYTKEELMQCIEEDRIDENPYLDDMVNRFVNEFEDELYELKIDIDYAQFIANADFDYDKASELVREIIDTTRAQLEAAQTTSVEEETEEVVEEHESEKQHIQSAPYPPIEKQNNVSMNMEEDVFFSDGSKNKYPAKKKGAKKVSHHFDNY